MNTDNQAILDFEATIRRIANHYGGSCDADVDDFTNEMRISAWQALQRCGSPSYVYRALWNRGRTLAKSRVREASRFVSRPVPAAAYEHTLDRAVDFERAWFQIAEEDRMLVRDHGLRGLTFCRLGESGNTREHTLRRQYKWIVRRLMGED